MKSTRQKTKLPKHVADIKQHHLRTREQLKNVLVPGYDVMVLRKLELPPREKV